MSGCLLGVRGLWFALVVCRGVPCLRVFIQNAASLSCLVTRLSNSVRGRRALAYVISGMREVTGRWAVRSTGRALFHYLREGWIRAFGRNVQASVLFVVLQGVCRSYDSVCVEVDHPPLRAERRYRGAWWGGGQSRGALPIGI